jgi:hypothetical protein
MAVVPWYEGIECDAVRRSDQKEQAVERPVAAIAEAALLRDKSSSRRRLISRRSIS